MISCFKKSATQEWKTDFENTHAISYTSVCDASEDGPKISKIIESFKQYDVFKYAAYRTSFKIRTIQKASKMHLVDITTVTSILKEFKYDSQSLDKSVTLDDAKELIFALYKEASKNVGFAEDLNTMSNLFCAFLHNSFVEGETPLLAVQMKITLILLSSAKLSEKHKYMFYYCSTDGKMTKQGLEILFKTLSKLAEIVGEQVTFGSHLVPVAVQNCLRYCKGKVTEKRFRKWLSLEPQTLVWISTLHRIAIAENAEHNVACDHCQVHSLHGLRYKCLQCMNYNLCQDCFLRGFFNKGHKEGHFMQEFCQPATVWQETKAAFSAVKNKLPFSKCPSMTYLSFDEESVCDSIQVNTETSLRNSLRNCTIKKSTAAFLIKELTSIITKLENDQKCIATLGSNKAEKNPNSATSSLPTENFQDFNSNIDAHLEKLRDLLKYLKSPEATKKETGIVSPVPHVPSHKKDQYFESTPLNSVPLPLQSKENLPEFSPQSLSISQIISKRQQGPFVSNPCQTFSVKDKENFTFSTSFNTTSDQCPSVSLELTNLLNDTSPKCRIPKVSTYNGGISKLGISKYNRGIGTPGLSKSNKELSKVETSKKFNGNLNKFSINKYNGDLSKISPLCLYSNAELEAPLNENSSKISACVSASSSSLGLLPSKVYNSTFALNNDGSLEIMEKELQAMLHQIEELLPQVSFLANDSKFEKEKVVSALSEMEDAVQKLSHLSIELSTGSTDL